MYSKIVNPKTGRKVSVNGRLGKRILRNYLIFLSGGTLNQKVCLAEKAAVEKLESCINLCHKQTPDAETNKTKCINKAQKSARERLRIQKKYAEDVAEGREVSDAPSSDALRKARLMRKIEEGGRRHVFHKPLHKIFREDGVIIDHNEPGQLYNSDLI